MIIFLLSSAKRLLNYIIDYIYPPRCTGCLELMQENGGFCGSCWTKLNFITKPYCRICCFEFSFDPGEGNDICLKCTSSPPSYDAVRSVLKFDEYSKKFVHALKYHDSTFIASNFSRIIYGMYKEIISNSDLIIPVPMYKWKRLFRLYNHSQILASELSKVSSKKMLPDILLKTRHTKSQTGLSKKAREINLKGSITVDKKDLIKNKKIILVDDVMTTGSTINLCARKLKKAGAASVVVLCIARTLL